MTPAEVATLMQAGREIVAAVLEPHGFAYRPGCIGDLSISHADYMRHTGHRSQAKYPGFSADPLDGFRHLADDLRNFCSDFTVGDGRTFVAAKKASESFAARSGLGKLSASDP